MMCSSDIPKLPSNFEISLSAISTSPLTFFDSIKKLETIGANRVHVDVMDGHFVPRLGLYPEFISEISSKTSLPIDVHLMVQNPFDHLRTFFNIGVTRIIPHVESSAHIHRLMSTITESGVKGGIALNPGTPIEMVEHILHLVDNVTIMAINPGIVGHGFIPKSFKKISESKKWLSQRDFQGIVEVDGGVTFANALEILSSGADSLVCGAGTVFSKEDTALNNLSRLVDILREKNEK